MVDLKQKRDIQIVILNLWVLKIFTMLENHIKTLIKYVSCINLIIILVFSHIIFYCKNISIYFLLN